MNNFSSKNIEKRKVKKFLSFIRLAGCNLMPLVGIEFLTLKIHLLRRHQIP
ncbi:hypothetical protein [Sulfolobus tengchongensis spindle-shaped virus 3]|nr:hypothetical protein [Sulfolobus tengchongensis spindle-shaped virus 3]